MKDDFEEYSVLPMVILTGSTLLMATDSSSGDIEYNQDLSSRQDLNAPPLALFCILNLFVSFLFSSKWLNDVALLELMLHFSWLVCYILFSSASLPIRGSVGIMSYGPDDVDDKALFLIIYSRW